MTGKLDLNYAAMGNYDRGELVSWIWTIVMAIVTLGAEYVLYAGKYLHHFLNWSLWAIILISIAVPIVAFIIWFLIMFAIGAFYEEELWF